MPGLGHCCQLAWKTGGVEMAEQTGQADKPRQIDDTEITTNTRRTG